MLNLRDRQVTCTTCGYDAMTNMAAPRCHDCGGLLVNVLFSLLPTILQPKVRLTGRLPRLNVPRETVRIGATST